MTLSYRISVELLGSDDQFDRLLDTLRRHRPAVDEISLFTEYWHHAYMPLDAFAERAALFGRRIVQLRGDGIASVGINMLDTLGHVDEAWDFLPALPFGAMVGHDGRVSACSFCPNSPEFRDYIREKYRLIARQRPDFIWVDDDIRMHHHGVAWGCFCPECLERFAGGTFDRERLVARLNAPDGGDLRRGWVEQNATVLEELLAAVAAVIIEIDPAIDVGLMTAGAAWTTYSGMAFDRWMNALGGRRARPGGGFYDDAAPGGMIHKAFDIGRQCRLLPATVDNVQYELENFPYQKLGKSVQAVLDECTLALAAGCNGVAFNMLKDLPGSMADYDDLFAAIVGERAVWETFVDTAQGLPLAGVWAAYDPQLAAKRPVTNGDWFGWDGDYDIQRPNALAEIGLPLAVDRASACATALPGRIAEAFSDDELREILAGGVLIDGTTLEVLWARGFGELTGVRAGRSYDNGVWERFTDHALNGEYAGDGRDARLSFWAEKAWSLTPAAGGVGSLTHLVGYDGSDCGSCLTVFENKLGGRVVTMGYAPWTRLASSAKRSQIIALADWASRGRLPLVIDHTVRVVPFVRTDGGERVAAVLLNASLDATGALDVRLRARPKRVELVTPAGRSMLSMRKNAGEVTVTVPDIGPWRTAILIGDGGEAE